MPGQGELNVLKIRVLKRGRQEGQSQKKRCYEKKQRFEGGGRDCEERDAGGLERLEKARNKFSPRASRRKGALQTHFRLWGSDL